MGAVSYSPSVVTMAYPVPFVRYSDLLMENREILYPTCILRRCGAVTSSKFCEMFDIHKTTMIGLPHGEETMTIC